MVGFLNRYVSIEKESTYGTNPASAPIYGEVDDESFATSMDLLTRMDMSHAVSSKSVTGTEYSEGGINMALQIDDFTGNVLAAFFPKTDYNSILSAAHTFDEPTSAADPYDSYTIVVGREQKTHIYGGMVASRLSLSANVGEYVMLSADFVGCRESATHAAVTTVAFDGEAVDALYFSNGNVFFDDGTDTAPAASASIKSVSFEINLNRDTDNAYALGDSTYRRAPPAQRREISGTIEFNQVLYGDQALDEPDYTSLVTADGVQYNDGTDPVMKLTFQEEASGASNYIDIMFYNIRWEAPSSNVSGRDTQTMSVGFIGLLDTNTADKAMRIQMKGGAAGTSVY
tara:strand:+ start:308 stop:1336 length:1029 start_codon:yes stop_codon:yes gene_type:complete